MKRSIIYCERTAFDRLDFYLSVGADTYFLFHQRYKRGVEEYFSLGVPLDCAIDCSRAHFDFGILNAMERVLSYVRYTEKVEGVELLRRTAMKKRAECAA